MTDLTLPDDLPVARPPIPPDEGFSNTDDYMIYLAKRVVAGLLDLEDFHRLWEQLDDEPGTVAS